MRSRLSPRSRPSVHRSCPHGQPRGGTAIDSNASGTSTPDAARADATQPPAARVDLSGAAALRSVMRIRPFRRLWIVLGVASFGDWLGLLATAIFASAQVTGSAAQGAAFGGTIAIRLLPALILGPVAGVMADRFDRRYTMVICDLIRFVLFASIPIVALVQDSGAVVVGWAAIATFIIETVTLMWIPAKEAAVPNLIPRARLEISNQLTLITTYGITPVLAALSLAALDAVVNSGLGGGLPNWAAPAQIALYFNALSRLATALVVFFGIKEISQGTRDRSKGGADEGMLRQFLDGWKYVGSTPLVRGLVLGIFGAFAGAGIVIGTAKFFTASLSAGDAAFSLLFGTLFIGLALGIGLGPMIVRELSRRRWFGMSIVLASGAVMFLAIAIHLSMALLGAVMVGAGAGMAFLAGTTLLGGEVADEVRGRVFAVVQIGTRLVLLLAISLSSFLGGAGGSRQIKAGDLAIDVSSTRILLLAAGVVGVWTGISAFRQMDDKRGVPVLADLWGSIRGRPLSPDEVFPRHGIFVVFEGGEGAGKSTQVQALAEALGADGRDVVVTREPGATDVGARIRSLVLERGDATDTPSPRAEALLYAADRAHHVATVVRPALARGSVVISDRYVDSSLAYQGAGRTLPVQEISWLSSWATGGLKPDLVVLLDVDPSVGLTRVSSRGLGRDRLESESRAFHERVRYAFLDLAAADPKRYLVLDAARPPAEISDAVATRVAGLLALDDAQPHPAAPPPVPESATPESATPESATPESAEPENSAAGDPAAGSPSHAARDAARPAVDVNHPPSHAAPDTVPTGSQVSTPDAPTGTESSAYVSPAHESAAREIAARAARQDAAKPPGWADSATDEVTTVEKPLDVLDDMLGIGEDDHPTTDGRELGGRRR
jgi:dTMP kinase